MQSVPRLHSRVTAHQLSCISCLPGAVAEEDPLSQPVLTGVGAAHRLPQGMAAGGRAEHHAAGTGSQPTPQPHRLQRSHGHNAPRPLAERLCTGELNFFHTFPKFNCQSHTTAAQTVGIYQSSSEKQMFFTGSSRKSPTE